MVDIDDLNLPSEFRKLLEDIPVPRFPDESSPWFAYFMYSFKVSGCGDYWDDCLENTIKTDFHQDVVVTMNGLEINPSSRFKLVSWLVDVMLELRLELSVLMYALKLLDTFVKKIYVPLADYQAFGLVCLWISDKYLSKCPWEVDYLHTLFPGATGAYRDDAPAFFPYAESRIFHVVGWTPGMVTTLSYFPDPEDKPDSTWQLSVKDFRQFQSCCRWVACAVEMDMELSYSNSCYDLAVSIYLITSQLNPSTKIDLDDHLTIPIWRKILLNRVIDSVAALLQKTDHPLVQHLNMLSAKNIFISRLLLLFQTYNKKSQI